MTQVELKLWLRENSRPAPMVFVLKLLTWFLLIATGGILFFTNSVGLLFGCFLLGLGFAYGVELQHQCIHNTAFYSRKANVFWGSLLGAPMLVNFRTYRKHHLLHHANLGTILDTPFFRYERAEPKRTKLAFVIRELFLFSHWRNVWAFQNTSYLQKTFIAFVTLGALWLVATSPKLLLVWIVPTLFVAGPFHYLIELPEHWKCKESKDRFQNTRTIKSNFILGWLTNFNNFHVEHHWSAGIPPEKLGILHSQIHHNILSVNRGYLEFYSNLVRGHLWKRWL